MMKNRNSKKFGFSLLGKPLRSGLNSLLCRWHSKARNPRIPSSACAHSFGFSLAEGMVMLVVVSILMAVSAPLIAKRSVADSKRIFGMRNNVITGAMGNQQKFLLGRNAPTNQDAKLDVNGLVIANEYGTSGDTLEISDRNNNILFSVDNDGNTNLPSAFVDFQNNGRAGIEVQEDSFLYVADVSLGVADIPVGENEACPINTTSNNFSIIGNDGNERFPVPFVKYTYTDSTGNARYICTPIHMPLLVPLAKGNKYNACAANNCYIAPASKAKADKTKKRKSNSSNSNQQTGNNNQGGNSSDGGVATGDPNHPYQSSN